MGAEGRWKNWSGKRDLNPRPSPWQGDALPLSYSRLIAIVLEGWDSTDAAAKLSSNLVGHAHHRYYYRNLVTLVTTARSRY